MRLYTKFVYHVYNRGVIKLPIFREKKDYEFFMNKIDIFKRKYFIKIFSYCLMPNHFHILCLAEKEGMDISKFMKSLQLSYALHFNKKYNRVGHLFEATYKRKLIYNYRYLSNIVLYIRNNPVRKGFVKHANDWPYSVKYNYYI
jgi:REP element-mobilizing transposase RayT